MGEVLKRVSISSYNDLLSVFSHANIDKELRYTLLKAYLKRAKKRLAQLLVLTRWFASPGAKAFFASVGQSEGRLATLVNGLNEAEFRLYQVR